MAIRHLLAGAAIFSIGTCYGERIRHTAMNLVAPDPIPYARVDYSTNGTYVNGERVYPGRIGEARCDWRDLSNETREHLALEMIEQNQEIVTAYIARLPTRERLRLAYSSLGSVARQYEPNP
jgi:hypothetical protein